MTGVDLQDKFKRGLQWGLRASRLPQFLIWRLGKSEEVDFWEKWLSTEGWRWPKDFRFRVNPDSRLQSEILDCLPDGMRSVKLLDVGSGPLTFLGKTAQNREIYITATDPLAPQYEKLLQRYRIQPIVPVQAVRAEDLHLAFPADHFDLACARNCLDHSVNPLQAIQNMLHVVKPGGWLLLWHQVNEGKNRGYRGFHQWNFSHQGNRLLISNSRVQVDVASELKQLAQMFCQVDANQQLFTKIQKNHASI